MVTSGAPAALVERHIPGNPPMLRQDLLVMNTCSSWARARDRLSWAIRRWLPSPQLKMYLEVVGWFYLKQSGLLEP